MTGARPVRLVLRQAGQRVAEAQVRLVLHETGTVVAVELVRGSVEGARAVQMQRLAGWITQRLMAPDAPSLAALRQDAEGLCELLEQLEDAEAQAARRMRIERRAAAGGGA